MYSGANPHWPATHSYTLQGQHRWCSVRQVLPSSHIWSWTIQNVNEIILCTSLLCLNPFSFKLHVVNSFYVDLSWLLHFIVCMYTSLRCQWARYEKGRCASVLVSVCRHTSFLCFPEEQLASVCQGQVDPALNWLWFWMIPFRTETCAEQIELVMAETRCGMWEGGRGTYGCEVGRSEGGVAGGRNAWLLQPVEEEDTWEIEKRKHISNVPITTCEF